MNYPSVIEEYFQLRREIVEIENRLDALKPQVAEQLRRYNGVAHLEGYDLKLTLHRTWEYSGKVGEMQQLLNDTRRQEREQGIARIKEQKDMLVLKSLGVSGVVSEEPAIYDE